MCPLLCVRAHHMTHRVTLQILNSEKSKLKTLENRNAVLERDVQRFNERKELEREVQDFFLRTPLHLNPVILDRPRGHHPSIYGIHGSQAQLY